MFGQPYVQVARWLGATAITTILCASAAQAQSAREADYALPAQALSRSLREVSVRSGTSVIAPSDLVAGRQAPPLRGRYRRPAGGRGAAPGHRVASDGRGRCAGGRPRAPTAEGEIASAAEQVPDAEPIIVTGSNIRGGQPTSPMIVLGRDEIADSGATSVEQLMRKVPQNAQSGVNRENFLVAGAGADPTEHGAGLNLRGLGQRATLVLMDGRGLRRATPAPSSTYPSSLVSAIERVEILTDGASAIYGSDAVGGVVNFIMRRRLRRHRDAASGGFGDARATAMYCRQASRPEPTGDGPRHAVLRISARGPDPCGRPRLHDQSRSRHGDLSARAAAQPFRTVSQELSRKDSELDFSGSFSRRDTQRTHFSAA